MYSSPRTGEMRVFAVCLLAVGAFALPARRPHFSRGYPQIVGGTDAIPGEFPYQLSFQDTSFGHKYHFCSASIYNNFTAITAAHCVFGMDHTRPRHIQVVAGEHNLDEDSGDEQVIRVLQIVSHEKFSHADMYNDIALLRVAKAFKFSDKIAPIKLPQKKQQTSGTCTVSGWGALHPGAPIYNVLQKVDVPVISDDECRHRYGNNAIIYSMICAGEEGKDSCQGDSGGPLKCGDYLGGIVSWGFGCALEKYPGVYTEVSFFVKWIHRHSF